MDAYQAFLASKTISVPARGLTESDLPALKPHLFAFQKASVAFGLRSGSYGLFLDTGLGKTACELEWCTHAASASNGRALILTPLAVARQIEAEGLRWGYPVRVVKDMGEVGDGINVCNYDRLHLLEAEAFGAVALDESSILKAFTGATTRKLISTFAGHRWRMAATATPAPNDHMELGQHAEFLGLMTSHEMLMRWFIADQTSMGSYRLKGHAVDAFWDWMASWSRMAEHPRDLGDDLPDFTLPELQIIRHVIDCETLHRPGDDGLFTTANVSATEMHSVKRQTAERRAEAIATIIDRSWADACGNLNTQRSDERNTRPTRRSGDDDGHRDEAQPKTATTCAITTEERSTSGQRRIATESTGDGASDTLPTQSIETSARRPLDGSTKTQSAPGDSARKDSRRQPSNGSSPNRAEGAPSAGEPRQTSEAGGSTSTTATQQGNGAGFCAAPVTPVSASSETTRHSSIEPWLIFCDTDYEQDELEFQLAKRLGPQSFFSVRGSQSVEAKERAIQGWIDGERPVLISKPSIVGYGMNFQFCRRMAFIGRSFSYEAWYQAVRRCWRFGQKFSVLVHLIVAEGEDAIGRVIDRKSADHQRMKAAMVAAMRRASGLAPALRQTYNPTHVGQLPSWLRKAS